MEIVDFIVDCPYCSKQVTLGQYLSIANNTADQIVCCHPNNGGCGSSFAVRSRIQITKEYEVAKLPWGKGRPDSYHKD